MKKDLMFFIISIFLIAITIFIAAAGTDLNNDGATNRTDLSLLATVYRTSNATFDRNNDGVVNLFDMVSVAKNVSNGSSGSNSSNSSSLDWLCNWNFTTGTSNNAVFGGTGRTIGQGRCFDDESGTTTTTLEVIPNPGGDWPAGMTNVLRSRIQSGASNNMISAGNVTTIPAVGEYIFVRIYQYVELDVGESVNKHWFHMGEGALPQTGTACTGSNGCYSGRWFNQDYDVLADSSYCMGFGVMFNQPDVGKGQGEFGGCNFKANRLEMNEMRFYRINSTHMFVDVRISHPNGTIIMNSSDFICSTGETGGCVDTGGYQIDHIGQYAVLVQDWRRVISLEVGHNGGTGPAALRYQYFGGAAVRKSNNSNDWIGPYPVGPEN